MNTNVVWLNLNPEASARDHWDETMLEDVFSRAMWRPAAPLTFEHHVIDVSRAERATFQPGLNEGAVVVFPARHHVDYVVQLNRMLATLSWVLLIGSGDEAQEFDWDAIVHPNRIVWAMGVTPGHASGVDRALGSGYTPDWPGILTTQTASPGFIDLFFCGQDTHERRHECLAACMVDPDSPDDGIDRWIVPTDHFLAQGGDDGGMSRYAFASFMQDTKVAPAPSGPENPDSFRLYEALEAGAVPVADGATPHGPVPGYWPFVFAEPVPFPVVQDWAELPAIVEKVRERWPRDASRIGAWWIKWKRSLVYALDRDVRALAGLTIPDYTPGVSDEFRTPPDDLITVIIPTCPIPSHPDTWMIEEVVESIREQLPTVEIVIACDGIRPTMADKAQDYEEFLHRLTRLCQRWSNVVPVILDDWVHQSGGTRAALELVTTPLTLFCEHDTPLTGEIDWVGLCDVVLDGAVNFVRLNHETAVGPDHIHMALDDAEPRKMGRYHVPLIRTIQWSQRVNLATTQFYRDRIMSMFPEDLPGTYLEWTMHGAAVHGYELCGLEEQWEKWKVAIYAPGDNYQRSLHLDGRSGAPTDDSVEAFKTLNTKKAERVETENRERALAEAAAIEQGAKDAAESTE